MAGIRYKGQVFSGAASFGDADHVAYDNSESGLTATDVQGAVDELNSKFLLKSKSITFSGTVSGTNQLIYTVENTNISGYRIVSVVPKLTVPNANVNFVAETFGSMDQQIIVQCICKNNTSIENPTCELQVLYIKI